jgi:hypothetical protein
VDCINARQIIGAWEAFAIRMPMVAALFIFGIITGVNVVTIASERRTKCCAVVPVADPFCTFGQLPEHRK